MRVSKDEAAPILRDASLRDAPQDEAGRGATYTSILPSSVTASSIATPASPRIISLWARPGGIIGKQFSFSSTTQATSTGSFRLENFRLQEIAGGAGLVTALMGAQLWVYGGDIELINAEFEAVDSRIGLITSGDVSITDSKIDGADFFLASFLGALTVDSSVVSARPALGVGGDPLMLYGTGLSINDSEVRSYAHTLQIIPFTILSGSPPPLPVNSSLQLINTTFRVTARDPVAAPGEGNLAILALAGESHINSNTFIVNGQLLSSNVGGSLAIRNNDFTIGHADIASSRYELTSVFAPGHLEFSNNTVTWGNTGGLAGGRRGDLYDRLAAVTRIWWIWCVLAAGDKHSQQEQH